MQGMKTCIRCKETKPLDQMVRNRSTKDGYSPYCKPCSVKNTIEARDRKREREGWVKRVPMTEEEYRRHRRNKDLQRKYGITLEQRDKMAERGCWICGIKETGRWGTLHIDHCHTTGKVRGMLCAGCNRGLGYFDDDPERLKAAAKYLRHGGKEF